ncbi:conserved protein of unknown function [Streptantibioticus cattleyicolor NRRL 8057 = DSM 46488]|nr:hypothetical protein [Streptomyces sp. SID5468]CCB75951.1 conserved protein of unknown function [Streptantibioticus cattleyicolor NRRL 8057 = DSM 46488]
MDLTEESVPLVRDSLRGVVATYAGPGLYGVSCIARGADSLFADAVLAAGGRLVVVLPSRDYRQAKVKPDHAAQFDRFLEAATEVVVMRYPNANREAYEAADKALLARADRLVAVWDGLSASGRGGTADVVAQAREAGLPVDVIWADGAARARGLTA